MSLKTCFSELYLDEITFFSIFIKKAQSEKTVHFRKISFHLGTVVPSSTINRPRRQGNTIDMFVFLKIFRVLSNSDRHQNLPDIYCFDNKT